MPPRVYVTGIGIVSAIGLNVAENFNSLKALKHGIGKLENFESVHSQSLPVGEIKLTNQQLAERLGIEIGSDFSRTALLGMIAAKEAISNAGLTNFDQSNMGIISATTVGGMDRTEMLYRNVTKENRNFIVTHVCGDSTEKIADLLDISGFVSTISTACSSSINSVMTGAEMIKNNLLDRVVAGGTDALSKFTINGFNSLMILDKSHNRPFDKSRTGLNLGEGAAFLVLESEQAIKGREDKILCELTGYANANDAFHQTASSDNGEGPFLAMSGALEKSGLKAEEIDCINAHGTGTNNNDLTEAIAIKRLFGSKIPPFSSTKPYTGHTLGAAGAVESVFSILSLRYNIVFPTFNFSEHMEEIPLSPETKLMEGLQIKNVLSNSFGFGGNDSSIIFSAV
ncbi:MAG: beta-ketoacyl-[acyl-carrier-protein] synthase family protein [Bacteroidales bacterium]